MRLLAEINEQCVRNAVEARHEATIKRLKEKYRSRLPSETVCKTVKLGSGYSWDCFIVFTDNTYINVKTSHGNEGELELDYESLELSEVKAKGLMADEDIVAFDEAAAYYKLRAQEVHDENLLHQVKSRFGIERLRELFA